MLKQNNLLPVERLVFVCKNLEVLFQDKRWKNFQISPLRRTRNHIQSCYVIFKNLMLEFLEVIDDAEGDDFVFFEEWKKADKPTWVGIGLKVPNLEETILGCKKKALENFISSASEYKKGFKHKSSLMDFKIQNRFVYLTEYDEQFEIDRNNSLFGSSESRKKLPSVEILPIDITQELHQALINVDNYGRVCLDLKHHLTVSDFEFDWLICRNKG